MLPPGLHSQQAGTILPTLMLVPPAVPPMRPRQGALCGDSRHRLPCPKRSRRVERSSTPLCRAPAKRGVAIRFAVSRTTDRTYDREFIFGARLIQSEIDRLSETPSTRATRVALIGFGTVGRAVAKILCENTDKSLRLTQICNRNVEKKKQPWVPNDVIWTDDVQSV